MKAPTIGGGFLRRDENYSNLKVCVRTGVTVLQVPY